MKPWSLTVLFLLLTAPSFVFAEAAPSRKAATEHDSAKTFAPTENISSYTLPPAEMHKSEALYKTGAALSFAETAYRIAVLVALLAFKVGPTYRNLAERLTCRRLLQAAIFVPLLLVTCDLLSLPLEVYGHHLQLAFGLSVQHWGSWFWDRAKAEILTLLLLVPALWCLYGLIRHSPRRWWIYSWLLAVPVMAFLVFVAPIVIDPLFNRFTPLEQSHPELVSAIEQVTQRGGLAIPRSRIFEMNASSKFTTYNAYVTGIGSTKRVVVWDNTARDLTIPEVLFIFGHEMGHYVLNHIWKGFAFAAVSMLAGFALANVMIRRILARWGRRWKIRELSDWASLPALMLVFAVLAFLGQPIANGFSRHLEHQADIYGLEVTHGVVSNEPEVAARDFQLLGEKSLSYPYPNRWLVFWTYNHPPIAERLRFALNYSPWTKGLPAKYVR